jgi:hypothetical protein
MARTVEESCKLIDIIVGRCVREPDFALAVLDDPEQALREYSLSEEELEDFTALSKRDHAAILSGWDELRNRIEAHRRADR